MAWKFYFWFMSAALVITYGVIFLAGPFLFIDIVDVVISFPSMIGLFLYSYQKTLFSGFFWKIYFCVYLAWDLYLNFGLLPLAKGQAVGVDTFFGFLLFLPLWVALFLFAFKPARKNSL